MNKNLKIEMKCYALTLLGFVILWVISFIGLTHSNNSLLIKKAIKANVGLYDSFSGEFRFKTRTELRQDAFSFDPLLEGAENDYLFDVK